VGGKGQKDGAAKKVMMGRHDMSSEAIYFISLSEAGSGSVHHELPFWYLAKNGFNVIRVGPGTVRSCLEQFAGTRCRHIQLPNPRGNSVWSRFRLHGALALETLRCRAQNPAAFYVYGSVCTPDAVLTLGCVQRERVIYHTQDVLEPVRFPWRSRIEGVLARRAGLVITNEVNRARFMASHYKLDSMPLVVPTALPREWPVPEPSAEGRDQVLPGGTPQNAKVILHQSPYSPTRMSSVLLEALAKLTPNYFVVFTGMSKGSAEYQACMATAKAHGVQDRVAAKPYVPFPQLLELTVNADVGVLLYPNNGIGHFYQCPGRLTEYAACGLAFVTSSFPGLENHVLKFRTGVTCNPYDPREVAEAIRQLADVSPAQVRERRRRIRQTFVDHLAYECGAQRLLDGVRRVVRGR